MRSDGMLWIVLGIIAVVVALLVFNHDSGQMLGIDNDDFATLAWAGILGTVIGLGLVTRARPTGGLLQQIAIWLALFVALVIGYRLYHGQSVLPGNEPVIPDSGAGVSVFLMEGVDSGLHFRGPDDVG